jgi:hypothetical protein
MNGTVTPIDVPLGAGTNANQISRVRRPGFAQFAGTVATPHLVVASNRAGHASVLSETGCPSIRSALLGVAVRRLAAGVSAAALAAHAARKVVARQSAANARSPRCGRMATPYSDPVVTAKPRSRPFLGG